MRTGRNRPVVVLLSAVVVGMVALTFAAVPLYRLFCQVTGYGGTTQVAQVMPELVAYDGQGQPETVKYHILSSLLLNELQKQSREIQVHRWGLVVMLVAGVAVSVRRRQERG